MTSLPVILEAVVAVLLFVTAGYCLVLERRIRSFRADQESLQRLVSELDSATRRAERAIAGLGQTTRDAQKGLDRRIGEARMLTRTMTAKTGSATEKPGRGRMARPNGRIAREEARA